MVIGMKRAVVLMFLSAIISWNIVWARDQKSHNVGMLLTAMRLNAADSFKKLLSSYIGNVNEPCFDGRSLVNQVCDALRKAEKTSIRCLKIG